MLLDDESIYYSHDSVLWCVCMCDVFMYIFHLQNLPEDDVLRHGKEAVEAHFKSKFKEVGVCVISLLWNCH